MVHDTPWSLHGDITEKPTPIPNASKTSVTAAAAMPPARTAPHETEENVPSSITEPAVIGVGITASGDEK